MSRSRPTQGCGARRRTSAVCDKDASNFDDLVSPSRRDKFSRNQQVLQDDSYGPTLPRAGKRPGARDAIKRALNSGGKKRPGAFVLALPQSRPMSANTTLPGICAYRPNVQLKLDIVRTTSREYLILGVYGRRQHALWVLESTPAGTVRPDLFVRVCMRLDQALGPNARWKTRDPHDDFPGPSASKLEAGTYE